MGVSAQYPRMTFSAIRSVLDAVAAKEEGLVNEVKFVGDETLADRAVALMDSGCWPDPQYPVGRIHSIYFDGPDRKALSEKVDGDNLKRKVRIRWYERPAGAPGDDVAVFIEIKHRVGAARRKFRHVATASERWIRGVPLGDPSLPAFLHRHAGDLGGALPLDWAPSICISYERRRYLCPRTGSRIAVDRNIEANRVNESWLPSVARIRLDRSLCEFKNEGGAPPPWAEALCRAGFRLRSFSKYGECMNRVLNGGAPA